MGVNSMTLSWVASTAGTPPITYQPQFRIQGAQTFLSFGSPLAGLSVVVTGLSPATTYEFDVIAINTAGTKASAIATGTTSAQQGVAPSAPGNLTVSQTPDAVVAPSAPTGLTANSLTATSFTLSWNASATGSAPINYQVLYKLHTDSSFAVLGPPSQSLASAISGLASSTAYDFQVTASNTGGSATSTTLAITTLAPAITPSPNLTTVTTVGPAITDSAGNLWTLTPSGQVAFNGNVVAPSSAPTPTVIPLATSLNVPWDIAFLPDSSFLVTQRGTFNVRHCSASGATLGTFAVPNTVSTGGEGGLMGIAVDPSFATNNFIYLVHTRTYSSGYTPGGNEVIRYTLNASANTISAGTTLLTYGSGQFHNGGACAVGPDGKLYITTGNGTSPNNTSQVLTGSAINDGKILRINLDGTMPADNPFNTDGTKAVTGDGKTRSAVWTWGHRNPQGICWDSVGNCWGSENGPTGEAFGSFTGIHGNDKINLLQRGVNYGFPLTYGTGTAVDQFGVTTRAPVFCSGSSEVWAPEGIVFLNNNIFFCALAGT